MPTAPSEINKSNSKFSKANCEAAAASLKWKLPDCFNKELYLMHMHVKIE